MQEVVITEKFLKTLMALANEYGWRRDFTEVADFVRWAYEKAVEKYMKRILT